MTSERTVKTKNSISNSSSTKFGAFFDKSVRTVRTTNNISKATMASPFGTTDQENNNNCNKVPHKSGLSSFLNINFHKRKKSKKKDHDVNENNNDKKTQGFLSDQVTSPVSNTIVSKKPEIESDAFGNTKSGNGFKYDRKTSLLNRDIDGDSNVTEEDFASWHSDAIGDILFEFTSENSDQSFSSNSTTGIDQLFSLLDLQLPKVNVEIEEDVKEIISSKKGVQQDDVKEIISSKKGVQQDVERPFKPQVPTKRKSFYKNATPLKFSKGKFRACKTSSNGSFCVLNPKCVPDPQELQKETSPKFHVQPKLRKSYSSEKKVNADVETNEEEQGDNVLCKKKILMGRRCRPIGDDEFDYYKAEIPSKAAKESSFSHRGGNFKTKSMPKAVNRQKSTSYDYGEKLRSNFYNFSSMRFQ
ncbi:hypothetical protein FRX31_018753 [Thalictrum thalictroides]|uniref:Uncharacterized protein n=1 Tax=Thalictrum thalictroides TaxID=46969 RepID=A0A7J6W3X8_THATH|nr:hypothetical protein FRX31_018753 [Thalictrum thalictroides]